MSLSELLSDLGDSVRSGDKIRSVVTARRMNAIIGAIKALARGENIIGGPGVRVKTASSAGVVLIGNPRTQAGEGYIPPFTCGLEHGRITVSPGYVNGQVPTINGVALDHEPRPTLPCYSGSNVVVLKTAGVIDTTTGIETVARAVIEIAQTAPKDSATAYAWTAYQVLTQFVYNEYSPPKQLPQYIQVNLKAANFGRINVYFA